jgi:16S rRNA G966 N2-methylase RsmD
MIGLVPRNCAEVFTLLEPEAGQGHLLDVFWECFPDANIKAVEINPNHCQRLREKDYDPICSDFLKVEPFPVDLVLMNPPFSDEMNHIRHAYEFLAEGGQLVSVASAMILRRNNKKGTEFVNWFESVQGSEYTLSPGSFKEAGTGVNAGLLIIDKEAA